MILSELLSGLEYTLEFKGASAQTDISTPVTDSREAVRDSLFICIDGTRRRGEDYAAEAMSRGAAAVVSEHPVHGAPTVVVKNARSAAAVIWNNFFHRPAENMRLYGITGTNGKTSTAAFLYGILKADGRKAGLMGTLGCLADGTQIACRGTETSDIPAAMTTPDPKYLYSVLFEMKKMGVTDVVMEVSSHSLQQRKVEPLYFDEAVFTNLSPEHLDCHGDMETYFRVKAELIKDKCRKAIINGDDPYGMRLYGIHVFAANASHIDMTDGCAYVLRHGGMSIPLHTKVRGAFTLYNTMLAAVCAVEAGIGAASIQKGIASVERINGRMERVAQREKYGFDVYIDYAHTPAAMEAALSGFDRGAGRLTALFGCGGDRDSEKRPLMGRAACRCCDRVIITSDNPRGEDRFKIINDIVGGIPAADLKKCVVIPSRADAIRYALETAAVGESVVLLGKGHEQWETLKDKKIPFSEREIVNELLREKYGK